MNPNHRIIIGLLGHQDIRKFQIFIKKNWQENHLFAKETSVFDWQHKGPHAYYCMVAKQGDDLVGVHCFIPLSHFDNCLSKKQIFLTLWRALEIDGETSIGMRLYNNIIKECAPDFMGSVGINSLVVPFHKWQGFKVGTMDHHVVLSPYVDKFRIAEVPSNLKIKFQKKKNLVSFQILTESHLKHLGTRDLYLHQQPLKSDVYIINRFMNHPVYKYDVYAVWEKDKLLALCIFRPIFKENSVVLRFVDFIGPNKAFPLLHDFVLDLLKQYNAEYVDLYSHGIPSMWLEKGGFINRQRTRNLVIPNYFEPFERKNVDLTFAYKASQTRPVVRLFKADGDQDRPSQIQGAI